MKHRSYLSVAFFLATGLTFWGCNTPPSLQVTKTKKISKAVEKPGIDLDSVIVNGSKVCMTQDKIFNKPMIPISYANKTYYGCCQGCVMAIKLKPDKYRYAKDPISGKKVDKAEAVIINFRGKAVYFASRKTALAFAKKNDLGQ